MPRTYTVRREPLGPSSEAAPQRPAAFLRINDAASLFAISSSHSTFRRNSDNWSHANASISQLRLSAVPFGSKALRWHSAARARSGSLSRIRIAFSPRCVLVSYGVCFHYAEASDEDNSKFSRISSVVKATEHFLHSKVCRAACAPKLGKDLANFITPPQLGHTGN